MAYCGYRKTCRWFPGAVRPLYGDVLGWYGAMIAFFECSTVAAPLILAFGKWSSRAQGYMPENERSIRSLSLKT